MASRGTTIKLRGRGTKMVLRERERSADRAEPAVRKARRTSVQMTAVAKTKGTWLVGNIIRFFRLHHEAGVLLSTGVNQGQALAAPAFFNARGGRAGGRGKAD